MEKCCPLEKIKMLGEPRLYRRAVSATNHTSKEGGKFDKRSPLGIVGKTLCKLCALPFFNASPNAHVEK